MCILQKGMSVISVIFSLIMTVSVIFEDGNFNNDAFFHQEVFYVIGSESCMGHTVFSAMGQATARENLLNVSGLIISLRDYLLYQFKPLLVGFIQLKYSMNFPRIIHRYMRWFLEKKSLTTLNLLNI